MSGLLHDCLATATAEAPNEGVLGADGLLSYRALDAEADCAAEALRGVGVAASERVAVLGHTAPALLAGVWGVLRVGGACVPLDPTAPSPRLQRVLDLCAARVVVVEETSLERALSLVDAAPGVEAVVSVGQRGAIAHPCKPRRQPAGSESARPGPDTPAYVLYTSGSTGVPKGVLHTHGSARAFVDWSAATAGLHPGDRVAGVSPLHFDMSTFEVYATALAGATLVPVPRSVKLFPRRFMAFLAEHRVSVLYTVPTHLAALVSSGALRSASLRALRLVVFAGEAMPAPLLRDLMSALPGRRFANWYGPTETNVCTAFDVVAPPDGGGSVPIGAAIPGDETLVVDDDLRPACEGELLVRGATVMAGYLGDDALTAKRMVGPRSLGVPGGPAFYRTGDLVRVRDDGALVFVGRRDHQVKRHGYRIELGDIDAAVIGCEGVVQCVSVQAPGDEAKIVTFVEASVGLSPADVLAWARSQLPPHMLPDEVRVVPALPSTSTGKVDRTRLAAALERGAS